MSVAMDKAKISGIAGIFGAVAAIFTVPTLFLVAGFGMFLFTLMIQYGSVKFKIALTLGGLLIFASAFWQKSGFILPHP